MEGIDELHADFFRMPPRKRRTPILGSDSGIGGTAFGYADLVAMAGAHGGTRN